MKVGILTLFYRNYNYGGVLQGYALKEYLNQSEGNEANLLRYKDGHNPIYGSTKEQMKQYGFGALVGKVWEKGLEKFTFLIKGKLSDRKKKFDAFIEENSAGEEYTDENIQETCKQYDCFISGSDQVWNPNCIRDGFLQKFVEKNCLKVSYAASLGRDRLTEKEQQIIAEELRKFNAISVREESTKKIFESQIEQNISVVLDPVFLLEKEQWKVEPVRREKPYVLCYFFSDSTKIRKKIQKEWGNEADILFIPYVKQKWNLFDRKGPGKRMYNVGPKDFINLIAGAECVYTDSFHGTAFSIVFNKPFYVFSRDKDKNKTSMNSRLYHILKVFGLEKHLIQTNNITGNIPEIDYQKVNRILETKRRESQEFLDGLQKEKTKSRIVNEVSSSGIKL